MCHGAGANRATESRVPAADRDQRSTWQGRRQVGSPDDLSTLVAWADEIVPNRSGSGVKAISVILYRFEQAPPILI